jgi:hypothetical protein
MFLSLAARTPAVADGLYLKLGNAVELLSVFFTMPPAIRFSYIIFLDMPAGMM